jgi:peptidyl-prolyl cis-trans isomerase D
MFDFVSRHKRLIQFVLALMIVPPFAFWGIQWTQREVAGAQEVARVGGQKISPQEFSEAMRRQQDRLRSVLGSNFDPSMLDSPAMRSQVIENMIAQRLLTQYAVKNRLTVSDEALVDATRAIPAFQVGGTFSRQRYDELLSGEGMTSDAFDASLRRDMLMQQISGAVAESAIISKTASRQFAQVRAQQREIEEYQIKAEAEADKARVSADAIRAFYDKNPARFRVPEAVDVDYVVLSADALLAAEKVTPEEVKAYYEANAARYGEPEQRRASHILIGFKNGAAEAEKAKAKERALRILTEVRKSPARFSELAKENSSDSGSASKGGDLGFFSRGMMVRPFEDAAFHLKLNEISDLVQSDYGFHIIKLTGIKPGKRKSLEEVRPEIEMAIKKERAGRRFAEAAETFSNLVYEQSDSLKPAAEKFNLVIQHAQGITRGSAPVAALSNPKVLASLFGEDSIKNRRNTEALETAPGVLVSAHVVNYRPATQRPLDQVREEIAKELARQESLALARKQGTARLEQLKKGNQDSIRFGPAKLVSREKPEKLDSTALSAVFRADVAKLPAYAGVENRDGYAIYRISRVMEPKADEVSDRRIQSELERERGSEDFKAFLEGLRAGTSVDINKSYLEAKQQ